MLPKTRVSTLLKELHGSPTGGHFGVMKTLQKVRERVYWNNVRSDVEKCCHTCDPCAARKGSRKRTKKRLQLYNVGALLERIVFKILGPLPRSSDGNNNILFVKDYFTKWPEAYPIPDQEASTVAEVLVQHWISRFGVPLQLHSDQGRNFDSAVCKRLCEILAIDKTKTTALHPQSDGLVERFNRTILNRLSLLVSSNQQDWYKKLPFFLLAYRSAVHETTGYSPSLMLFGRDFRLPADLLFSRPPDVPLATEEYIKKLYAWMEEIHHLARDCTVRDATYETVTDSHTLGDKIHFRACALPPYHNSGSLETRQNGIRARKSTTVKVHEDPLWAVLLVTPLMKRNHHLFSSKEITFIDSTSSCEASSSTITILLSATKAGALPLAVMVHASQSIQNYINAFQLLKMNFPPMFWGTRFEKKRLPNAPPVTPEDKHELALLALGSKCPPKRFLLLF
ncbi:retrovirus-related Pol polyprotein from transposon 412 [Trichonephila clavipes]|nr:retrovirus-related Pol polyprotein from transposon 412 [Trichonephila clavipes]